MHIRQRWKEKKNEARQIERTHIQVESDTHITFFQKEEEKQQRRRCYEGS